MMNNMKSALGEVAPQPDTVLSAIRAEIYEAQSIVSEVRHFVYEQQTRLLGPFPVAACLCEPDAGEGEMNFLRSVAKDLRASVGELRREIEFLSSI